MITGQIIVKMIYLIGFDYYTLHATCKSKMLGLIIVLVEVNDDRWVFSTYTKIYLN